jgi:hypothetical protein
MHVDRLLDAAIITTASVLLVGVFAMALFAVTAALERWIDRPMEQPPLLPASDAPTPTLFDQDVIEDTRQAS